LCSSGARVDIICDVMHGRLGETGKIERAEKGSARTWINVVCQQTGEKRRTDMDLISGT
jgi:hypothetical protein